MKTADRRLERSVGQKRKLEARLMPNLKAKKIATQPNRFMNPFPPLVAKFCIIVYPLFQYDLRHLPPVQLQSRR